MASVPPLPMQSHSRGLRVLAVPAVAQLVLSAAYIVDFSRTYGYGERLIVLHISVVASLLLAGLLILGLLTRHQGRGVAMTVAVALPLVTVVAIILVYTVNVVSNRSWGHNVTYDLALQYLPRPLLLLSYVPLVADAWTIATVAGVTLAGAWLLRPHVVREGVEAVFRTRGSGHQRRMIGSLAAAVVGFVLMGVGVVITTPWESRSSLLARDPFIGFVFVQRQYEFVESRVAIRHRREGPVARAAYAGTSSVARRNVVLIVVDSLRADHMEVYGYPRRTTPFLEGLRQAGRLGAVRLAMSSCAESNCGISSILSSKTLGSTLPENFKLHDLLHDQGYRLHFILSGKHEWFGLREFYGGDMETYFDGTRAALHAATDDRVLLEGLAPIPSSDGRPTYFHFHLMSTHQIGVRQDRYQVFTPAEPHGRPGADLQSRINGYDNAVIQADAIIGELLTRLQQKGYLDDALIMIVADHGESLGGPGEDAVGHGPSLGHEALNIPWLLIDSDFSAYRNLEFGTQVDVAPTIVSRLGLPVPSTWEGRSLLEPRSDALSFHYSNFAGRSTYAVVQARGPALWKLIQSRNGERLFDLNADPREQRDLVSSADPALLASLRAELAARVTAAFPEN